MKTRIEELEYKVSESKPFLYGIGVLFLIERGIKSALRWLWDYLNHILIGVILLSLSLTVVGLESNAISVALALILFITQGIVGVVLIRAIVTESKVKKVEESPKVIVQNVQTLSAVSEPQQNVPMQSV